MDNRQLLYYLAIVEEENISRASKRLFVAQPYLSRQLVQLEDELGVKLIERTTRKFRVTDAGKLLAYRARQMLQLSEATLKELRDAGSGLRGNIRIGCISSAFETILLEKLEIFHKRYGEVCFEVSQASSFEILERIRRGVIEIGIVRSPVYPGDFSSFALSSEPLIAMSARKRARRTRREISLRELAKRPLLILKKFETEIEEAFGEAGVEAKILARIDDARPLLSLAERGGGTAIIPRDWSDLAVRRDMERMTIPELKISSGIEIVWLKNCYMSAAAANFLSLLKSAR